MTLGCRIAIARAVYNDCDIMVFDDCLSAMDSHVGNLIFERCIKGLLRDKLTIMATNQIALCREFDSIFVLENGTVVQTGTFDQLSSIHGSPFQTLLQHVTGNDDREEEQEHPEVDGKPSADAQQSSVVPHSNPLHVAERKTKTLYKAEDSERAPFGLQAFLSVCRCSNHPSTDRLV